VHRVGNGLFINVDNFATLVLIATEILGFGLADITEKQFFVMKDKTNIGGCGSILISKTFIEI